MHSSDVYLPLQYKDEDKNIAKGDIILVGSTGSELVIGKAAFISKVLENTQIGAFLRIVRPYCKEYAQYVAVIFKTTFYREYIRKKASGTNINNIKSGHLENFLIPVPPVTEQHRIVNSIAEKEQHFLVIQSSRIRYKHILSGTPTSLRQQLIQAAIQGQLVPQNPNDEPANKLLESIAEERTAKLGKKAVKSMSRIERRGSKTYELLPDGSEKDISEDIPFEIPSSWEWSRMDYCLDVRDGTHDTPAYVSSGVPLVTSKNLRNGEIDFSSTKNISIQDHNKISERSKVDSGDILFAMIGSIGNPVLYHGNKIFSIKNMALFKQIHEQLSMDFVLLWLIQQQDSMRKKASGGLQSFVSLNYLRKYLIPIPPMQEQHRIVEKLDALLKLV